jgi:hypothetical protein
VQVEGDGDLAYAVVEHGVARDPQDPWRWPSRRSAKPAAVARLRAAAAAAKISPETLRRVEHGKATRMDTALAVATAYERDLDELFDVGEVSPQDVILNAFVQTADADQLRSVAFAIAVHGMREREEMSGDGVYAKLAREFERGAAEKPRRTGVRWEPNDRRG